MATQRSRADPGGKGGLMTSGAPLAGSGSGSFSIPDLVRMAAEGSIRVPTFQRSFVWDAADVRKLFDSIYRGFPVGTILLWRNEAPAGEVALGPVVLTVPRRTDALWVVDGQQRITSLFGVLAQTVKDVDDRFEVYFDPATSRFINPRRGVVPHRAIPVREALETRTLLTWLREHESDLELTDLDVADRLGGAIRDYRIPAYIVSGNDQRLLREVFDRVNSAGRPIRRAQVFHALFAGDAQPGSPRSVVEELRGQGFGRLDENRIVQSLLAIRGGDVQRDVHDEFDDEDDPAEWYDRTEVSLSRAIDFLRAEGIPHLSLMPHTLPLPVLAAFFYLHPEPEPWILRLLARWLWRGWVHDFGRGGQTPVLRRAVRAVNPDKLSPSTAPSSFQAVAALLGSTTDAGAPRVPMQGFRTDQAHSRLILLALAALGPLDGSGQRIGLSEELEKLGANTVTELVTNHRSDAAARGFWPAGSRPTGAEDEKVLASHAIDPAAASMLRDRDIDGFLSARRRRLDEFVQGFLNNRLEPGALVRPPLSDLMVAEGEGVGAAR
ncbi:MAG TPA: DUF262 domain-containing protein [Micromonosporaceae bacterium]|nr:DUF262 domain-containing protein [Micromonosporaceae bacterium]